MFTILVLTVTVPGQARTDASVAARARWLANHGGVLGTCKGCATPRLKALSAALIGQQFQKAGVTAIRRAICFSNRESGLNVGAVSSTDDHGLGQINRPSHPQFDYWRMNHDPAYSAWAMWVVSSHGRDWSPWNGGAYNCA